jgi:hypothetical protein
MAKYPVKLVGGGSADWTKPVRAGGETLSVTYDGYFMLRLSFHFGQTVLMKTRIPGADDMSSEGVFLRGSGRVEAEDVDGDLLLGNVVWGGEEEKQGSGAPRSTARGDAFAVPGLVTFEDGTGKWEGTRGSLNISVWALPDDLDEPMPPSRPVRFHAFFEGSGSMTVRALLLES